MSEVQGEVQAEGINLELVSVKLVYALPKKKKRGGAMSLDGLTKGAV